MMVSVQPHPHWGQFRQQLGFLSNLLHTNIQVVTVEDDTLQPCAEVTLLASGSLCLVLPTKKQP